MYDYVSANHHNFEFQKWVLPDSLSFSIKNSGSVEFKRQQIVNIFLSRDQWLPNANWSSNGKF